MKTSRDGLIMTKENALTITTAEVVLSCSDLNANLTFFTEELGFGLVSILPADNPAQATLSGYGLRLFLKRSDRDQPSVLRLSCRHVGQAKTLKAPNGTLIELVDDNQSLQLPPIAPVFSIQKFKDGWHEGRAGMLYRDLFPDRMGGRFIASHIRIPAGGPPPDYVHFHKIRFQMIFCYKGMARVAYEDQGAPVLMQPGDCVLQPSQIRHKVLEFGDNSEFIEIGCPAEHETCTDPAMVLPTKQVHADRDFNGQRFVFHKAQEASWLPWRMAGFEYRETGIEEATNGLAGVRIIRPKGESNPSVCSHDHEFLFFFVLAGQATLSIEGYGDNHLDTGDCCVLPSGAAYSFNQWSDDLELLETSLPGALES